MKILISGGTGFLGSHLVRQLVARGDEVIVITRNPGGAPNRVALGNLDGAGQVDAVINLAGESVVGRWTTAKKQRILESRLETTSRLAEYVKSKGVPTFLSGTAIGVYGDTGPSPVTEQTDIAQVPGFLADVCRRWEAAAQKTHSRTVFLRTSNVFDPSGGFLKQILPMLRRFPAVVVGNRNSYLSWISLEDWTGLVLFALDHPNVIGPLNLSSPHPVTQEAFTREIANHYHKRVWGAVPAWAVKLGLGEFADAVTASQRVLPEAAQQAGFRFADPELLGYIKRAL